MEFNARKIRWILAREKNGVNILELRISMWRVGAKTHIFLLKIGEVETIKKSDIFDRAHELITTSTVFLYIFSITYSATAFPTSIVLAVPFRSGVIIFF